MRARYRAVIVGRESGNRLPLDFVRFRTPEKATVWCLLMNDAHIRHRTSDLTYYDYERIPR